MNQIATIVIQAEIRMGTDSEESEEELLDRLRSGSSEWDSWNLSRSVIVSRLAMDKS